MGADHVYKHEHQLSTYASDGLPQYAVIPGHGERLGRRLRVLHPMELLRMSIEGG